MNCFEDLKIQTVAGLSPVLKRILYNIARTANNVKSRQWCGLTGARSIAPPKTRVPACGAMLRAPKTWSIVKAGWEETAGTIQTGHTLLPNNGLMDCLRAERSSDVVFAPFTPAAPRLLQLAQQAAEGINLAFVGEFLAFGKFDQFQNILHLTERLAQRFDDLRHFAHRLADGGTIRLGGARRGKSGLNFLPRRCGSYREFGRTGGRRGWRRQRFSRHRVLRRRDRRRGTTTSASAAMSATASAAWRPGRHGLIRFG